METLSKIASLGLAVMLATATAHAVDQQQLDTLRLPEGFSIEIYADNIRTARGLDFAENGILFVGSKDGGVYAVTPDRSVITVDNGLNMPVGLDYHQGALYVSAVSRVLKYDNILSHLDSAKTVPEPVVLNDGYPKDRHHGWKFIKIGPDGLLYIPVGAPCNACKTSDRRYAGITRMDLDGGNVELVAEGVRNTVGFDWHPDTGELWFTDNGRDLMGDDVPPDELNRLPEPSPSGSERLGRTPHFGFPYLHGSSVQDPRFWKTRPKIDFQLPEYEFQAHVAALGMRFYTADHFPERYHGGIFVAQHGSWNRSRKVGYRVVFFES